MYLLWLYSTNTRLVM